MESHSWRYSVFGFGFWGCWEPYSNRSGLPFSHLESYDRVKRKGLEWFWVYEMGVILVSIFSDRWVRMASLGTVIPLAGKSELVRWYMIQRFILLNTIYIGVFCLS